MELSAKVWKDVTVLKKADGYEVRALGLSITALTVGDACSLILHFYRKNLMEEIEIIEKGDK